MRPIARALVLLTAIPVVALTGTTAVADHSPELSYVCHGGFPFDAWHFEDGRAEERRTPRGRALRRLLRSPYSEHMPKSGWRRVGSTDRYAAFVARDDEGNFYSVLLKRRDGRWSEWGWGDCTPEAAIEDASIVEWALDPQEPPPLPGDNVIHALVSERACHGFTDPLDRMNEPIVFYEDDRIYIVLTAEPLEGAQTCPGTPPVKYDIHLDQAIGTRELFDAGTYPPQPAARPFD